MINKLADSCKQDTYCFIDQVDPDLPVCIVQYNMSMVKNKHGQTFLLSALSRIFSKRHR